MSLQVQISRAHKPKIIRDNNEDSGGVAFIAFRSTKHSVFQNIYYSC